MPPTADSPAAPFPPAEPGVSGKWVILGILALAFVAASGSWWFRYNATHRAVEFWGPQAARLIRDAPRVDFFSLRNEEAGSPSITASIPLKSDRTLYGYDQRIISKAHGLAHLRNALLEDRSFNWPAEVPSSDPPWRWALIFWRAPDRITSPNGPSLIQKAMDEMRDKKQSVMACILFTVDCAQATVVEPAIGKAISCEPIAAGLREMFAEFAATNDGESAAPSKRAAEAASPNAEAAK